MKLRVATLIWDLRQLSVSGYRRRPVGRLDCVHLREAAPDILEKRNAMCMHPHSCCRKPARPVRPLLRIGWPPCLPCAFATPLCGYTHRESHIEPSQPHLVDVFSLWSQKYQIRHERSDFGRCLVISPRDRFLGRLASGTVSVCERRRNFNFFICCGSAQEIEGARGKWKEGKAEGRRAKGRGREAKDFSGPPNGVPSRLHASWNFASSAEVTLAHGAPYATPFHGAPGI